MDRLESSLRRRSPRPLQRDLLLARHCGLTSAEKSGADLILRWKERTSGATYSLLQSNALINDWTTSGVAPANDGAAVGSYQPRMATLAIGSGKLFFRVRGVEN